MIVGDEENLDMIRRLKMIKRVKILRKLKIIVLRVSWMML